MKRSAAFVEKNIGAEELLWISGADLFSSPRLSTCTMCLQLGQWKAASPHGSGLIGAWWVLQEEPRELEGGRG